MVVAVMVGGGFCGIYPLFCRCGGGGGGGGGGFILHGELRMCVSAYVKQSP